MGLELKDIRKSFEDRCLYDGLTLHFASTGLYVLCGENGAGKTTLVNIIGGKDSAYSGSMIYNQKLIDDKNRLEYSENEVAYVTQDSLVFDDLSLIDNLLLPFEEKDIEKAKSILDSLSLGELTQQLGSQLSGGEKQRLSLARILYSPKPIVLLDEITAHLDDKSARIIIEKVIQLAKSHLVIFITHDTRILSLEETSILRLKDKKIFIEKEAAIHDDLVPCENGVDFKEKNLLKQSFNREKSSHILLSLVVFFMTLVGVTFSFLGSSFATIGGENRYFEKVKEVFSYNSSVLPVYGDQGLTGTSYPLFSYNLKRTTQDYDLYSEGMFLSGVVKYQSTMADDFELVSGSLPTEDGEGMISDLCLSKMESFALGDTISFIEASCKVVGVYKAKESSLNYRYAISSESTSNLLRVCYGFMTETVFMMSDNAHTNINLYQTTKDNREKFCSLEDKFVPSIFSSSDVGVIAADKNGNNVLYMFSFASLFFSIGLGLLIGEGLFFIVFVVAFCVRNKRKYILLRFMGMSRSRQTKDNLILFGSNALITSLISLALSLVLFIVFNSVIASSLIGCATWIIEWDYLMSFLYFAVAGLFIVAFGLALYKWLSTEDLSSEIDEVKQK